MRVLLDSQQWSYLVDPPHDECLGLDPDDLRHTTETGGLEIVGSVEVLQELVGTAARDRPKYKRMVDLFFEFSGGRLLVPLSDRQNLEVDIGGLLDDGRRYLGRDVRRSIERQARRAKDVADIAQKGWEATQAFKAVEEAARAHVRAEGATAQVMRAWIREVEIDSWVRDIVDEGNRLGEHTILAPAGAGIDRFPSCWVFVAYRLARVALTVGEGRRIQASDIADAHHAASGPYVDVIVTDDSQFRASLDLIPAELPFTWESSGEFAKRLQ